MLLAAVQPLKQVIGCRDEIVFTGQVVGFEGGTAQHPGKGLLSVGLRQSAELVDKLFGGEAHR